jgi:type II secretory pathway component PulF
MTNRRTRIWPWVVDVVLISYVAWVFHVLAVHVPDFAHIFADFGADVPTSTSFAIRACTAPIPYVLAATVALILVSKNLILKDAVAKLGTSLLMLIVVSVYSAFVQDALFQPLYHLIKKLGG